MLTELGDTSRTMSPNLSSLNTSQNLRTGSGSRKRAIKSQNLKDKEQLYRQQEDDWSSDFIEFLELLVDFFKQLERIDAAGCTL